MLKKILINTTLFLTLLYVGLIVSMPREGLWFKMEEFLYSQKTIIDGETISNTPYSLVIENANLVYENMSALTFKEGEIVALLFYNQINLTDLRTGADFSQFKNLSLDSLQIEHSVIKPTKLMLRGAGEIGEFKGRVDVVEKTIDILLYPSDKFKKMRAVMGYFKKHENGGYVYNGKF
jgi:hypothetical protein